MGKKVLKFKLREFNIDRAGSTPNRMTKHPSVLGWGRRGSETQEFEGQREIRSWDAFGN